MIMLEMKKLVLFKKEENIIIEYVMKGVKEEEMIEVILWKRKGKDGEGWIKMGVVEVMMIFIVIKIG